MEILLGFRPIEEGKVSRLKKTLYDSSTHPVLGLVDSLKL